MNLRRFVMGALAAWALSAVPAIADNSVLYWNEQALNVTRLSRNPPPVASFFFATYHAAIFDAVNGITHTHKSWLANESAPAGANLDAAVAGAAQTVFMALWSQAANPRNVQLAYEKALAEIPDGQAKTDGLAWGKHVAELVLKKIGESGYNKPIPGKYSSNEPGKWRETPPNFRPPTLPFWGKVTPFVMTSPSQFRPPPPPALDSKQFADEAEEIARIGTRDGAERTEYQTLSAPFWADDLGSCTPPGHWNIIAQDLARRHKLSVPEAARLFALLNFASADAGIACWDAKFFYSTWRPETAIREITKELNPHATSHADFIPLMGTPSFPSYTSGHSTFSAAAARTLELYFGTDDIEFTATSDGLPGAVRSYKKLSECRAEIGMSRLWGGIHYMVDNIEGTNCGTKIADWVFANAATPQAAVTTAAR